MDRLIEYLSAEQAAELTQTTTGSLGAHEVAVVRNLDYIYSPVEIYPLAPRLSGGLDRIAAFAVDMDGTSTTTEPLALHSLEYMVRRFTGRMSVSQWEGLDREKDYPYVIGNSNFRHTEFLVGRYRDCLNEDALRRSFIESLLWTLSNMDDRQRLRDVALNARNCGLGGLLDEAEFRQAIERKLDDDALAAAAGRFADRWGAPFHIPNYSALVSAALDIYYARYHSILKQVEAGEGERLSHELLGESGRRLIEPMPGYGVFIALVKGWLADDAAGVCGLLRDSPSEAERLRLAALGHRFAEQPAKLALVTASIAYETHTVVREVFRVMQHDVATWPLPASRRAQLGRCFSDYKRVYDAFVTASDSSEARLKPHRDLYSIALYRMSIPREDYCRCVGLEDTEPGVVSLRAAGVGCAVALPNTDTSGQDYSAAGVVVHGGLPELLLDFNAMLDKRTGE